MFANWGTITFLLAVVPLSKMIEVKLSAIRMNVPYSLLKVDSAKTLKTFVGDSYCCRRYYNTNVKKNF